MGVGPPPGLTGEVELIIGDERVDIEPVLDKLCARGYGGMAPPTAIKLSAFEEEKNNIKIVNCQKMSSPSLTCNASCSLK